MNQSSTATQPRPADQQPAEALPAGTPAPDFSLKASTGGEIRLSDLRGHPVILAFYPADWSPVCTDELALFNEVLGEFEPYNAQLLGISVDGVWSHKAFAEQRGLQFPLLADFEPKGAVARAYGVYARDDSGQTQRALFVIDGDGVIRWSYVSPKGQNPGADGILRALERMRNDTNQ